jgi:menaquinone-9 beta-reductase
MPPDVDLAVVGGGPVGLAVAIEARMAGLTVRVIEPRALPIDKACGEGLMPGAVRALDQLGVDPAGRAFAGIAYVGESSRVEHRFTSGPGRGVRRTVLHEALGVRADELGVMRTDGKAVQLTQNRDQVTVSGEFGELTARWLVGADGLHSTVRRLAALAGREQRASARRYGVRRHFQVAPWSDLVEVHWTRAIEVYVTPVDENTVGIALLGPSPMNFAQQLAGIPAVWNRVADALGASDVRGAGPLRQRSRRRTAGRVLLAGDASGYVDALTGEGLRVGFAQAHVAVQAIVNETPRAYERAWTRSTRDFRILTSGLVTAARSPLRGRIVPAAVASPALFGRIVERLAD